MVKQEGYGTHRTGHRIGSVLPIIVVRVATVKVHTPCSVLKMMVARMVEVQNAEY